MGPKVKITKEYPNLEIQREFHHFDLSKWMKPGNLTVPDSFHVIPHYTELRQLPFVYKEQTKGLNAKWIHPIRTLRTVAKDAAVDDTETDNANLEIVKFSSYLLGGDDFFYYLGDSRYTRFQFGIVDTATIAFLSQGIFTYLFLLVRADGYLFTILCNDEEVNVDKPDINSQFLSSTSISGKEYLGSGGDWKIITRFSSRTFALANFYTATIHFYTVTDSADLKRLNTLQFEDAEILTCNWFRGKEQVLFLALLRNDRILYHSLNWDHIKKLNNYENVNLSQLTNLHGEIPNGSIPIGDDTMLLYSHSKFQLVKSIQIKCGEPVPMFRFPILRGISSWFDADYLMKSSFIIQRFPELVNAQRCTIICNSIGTIFCVFADVNEEIHYFCLGRFKGLKIISVPSVEHMIWDDKFTIIGLTFNRTIKITINLRKMIKITSDTKQSTINELKSIIATETLASTGNNYNKIITTGFDNEIWLTSPSSVAQISVQPKIPFLRLENESGFLSNIDIMKNLQIVDGYIRDHKIIWGLNELDKAKLYQLSPDYELSPITEFQNTDSLLYLKILSNNHILHITENSIQIIKADDEIKVEKSVYCPAPLSGYASDEERTIVWSFSDYSMWEIKDLEIRELNYLKSLQTVVKPNEKITITLMKGEIKSGHSTHLEIENSTMKHTFAMDTDNLISVTPSVAIRTSKKMKCFSTIGTFYDKFDSDDQLTIHIQFSLTQKVRKFKITLRISKGQFYEIKEFGKDDIVVFTLDKIYLLKLIRDKEKIRSFELVIPIEQQNKSILDLFFDDTVEKLYILYEDGLTVTKPKYVTWNKYDHLLPNTRNLDKKFLYLKKINRLLIVNNNLHEWYLMKLKNGKIIKLESDILQNGTIEDMVELNSSSHCSVIEDGVETIQLVLLMKDQVKYVKLAITEKDIIVNEMDTVLFENELYSQITPIDENSFALLEIGLDNVNDRFMKYRIDSNFDKFAMESMTIYPSKGEIIDWKIISNNLLIINAKGKFIMTEKIFDDFSLDSIDESSTQTYIDKIFEKSSIIYDEYCYVTKICPINDSIFVLVNDIDSELYVKNELLFFHIDNFVTMKELPFTRTELIDSIVTMGNVSLFTYFETVNQNKAVNTYKLLKESKMLEKSGEKRKPIDFSDLSEDNDSNVLESVPYYDLTYNYSLVGRGSNNIKLTSSDGVKTFDPDVEDLQHLNYNFSNYKFIPFLNRPPHTWNTEYERIKIEYAIQDFKYSEGIIFFLTTDGTVLQFDNQPGVREDKHGVPDNGQEYNTTIRKAIEHNLGYYFPRIPSIQTRSRKIDNYGIIT